MNDSRRTQDLEDIRAVLRANRATLDFEEVRQYFRLFDRESLAGSGGVVSAVHGEREPYEALDDLMRVVEAFCAVWPDRALCRSRGVFLL